MSIVGNLQDEMKKAMKAQDAPRLSAIRMLISAIRYAGIDFAAGGGGEMTDEQVIPVLAKEAKKRRESIVAYRAAGRTEQAKQEEFELAMIEGYLPKMMDEAEVRIRVLGMKEKWEGRTNFGEVMQSIMKEFKGQAEGSIVAKVVKEVLTQQ